MASKEELQQAAEDEAVLASFGYEQVLHRAIGWGRSAAVNISTSSVTTAIVSLFAFGLITGGATMIWFWTAGFVVAFFMALVFAELGSSIPVAGALYQWSSRLSGPRYGYATGFIYVVAQIAICASIAYAIPSVLAALFGFELTQTLQVVLTIAMVWLAVLINAVGVILTARVATIGVIAELVGMLGMTIALLIFGFGHQPVSVIFSTTGIAPGTDFWAFALPMMVFGAYAYTAMEMPTDIGEETIGARRAIPKAVIASLVTTFAVGFVFLLSALIALPSYADAIASANPLEYLVTSTLNQTVWDIFAVVLVIAIFVCLVGNVTLTSRAVFSLARDGKFPLHRALSKIPSSTLVPVGAIVLIGVIASLLAFWASQIAILAAAATAALYLAYLMVIWAGLWKRAKGDWVPDGPWTLGRWALPVYIIASVLGGAVLVDLAWPRTPDIPWYDNWMPFLLVAAALGFALVYMLFNLRRISEPLGGSTGTLPHYEYVTPDTDHEAPKSSGGTL